MPQPKFLLEQAERFVAKQAGGIDQNSLHYEVFLRKAVQEMHILKLEEKQNQWKEELLQAEETLDKIKDRSQELEKTVKDRQAHKIVESETSKEISKLLENKAKAQNEIEKIEESKNSLNNEIDNLHKELEELSEQFSHRDLHLNEQIQTINARLTMSDNERIENMSKEKNLLLKKQENLIKLKQEVYEKWEAENKQLVAIFDQTEEKKTSITQELLELQYEKELLEKERDEHERDKQKLDEEMQIIANNQNTLVLHSSYQDDVHDKDTAENVSLIVKKASSMILEILKQKTYIDPANVASALYFSDLEPHVPESCQTLSDILTDLKCKQDLRMIEIEKNCNEQVSILNTRIEEETSKRSKSPTPIPGSPLISQNNLSRITTASQRLNNLSQRISHSNSKSLNVSTNFLKYK